MSVSAKGNELPKKGKELPLKAKRQALAREYAQAISEVLKEELRRGASIKTIMNWTGAGERTVKGWVAGSNRPMGEYLVALTGRSDLVLARVLALAGRKPIVTLDGLQSLRMQIVGLTEVIDDMLE